MALRISDYDELAKAVKDAGFFTPSVEDYGTWHRLCFCSVRDPNTGRLSGNSFWVSQLSGRSFLGVWGGWQYILPDQSRLAELCISWLQRGGDITRSDFDEELKVEFGLIRLGAGEFDKKAGID